MYVTLIAVIQLNRHFSWHLQLVTPQDREVNEVSEWSELTYFMDPRNSLDSFLSSLAPNSAAKYKVRIEQFELYCKINDLATFRPSFYCGTARKVHGFYIVEHFFHVKIIFSAYISTGFSSPTPWSATIIETMGEVWIKDSIEGNLCLFCGLIVIRSSRKSNWIDFFRIVPIHQNRYM